MTTTPAPAQMPYTRKTGPLPKKVTFTWEDSNAFRGVLNRHTRRRFMKLSRLKRLTTADLPVWLVGAV